MRSFRSAEPRSFVARSVTTCSPRAVVAPPNRPVWLSSVKPAGSPSAANRIGRLPVAAIVYSSGWPGRMPKIIAPLIRGRGDGFGVRITGASSRASPAQADAETAKIASRVQITRMGLLLVRLERKTLGWDAIVFHGARIALTIGA